MTCSEKAAQWGVPTRAVNARCRNGRMPGEVKHRGSWFRVRRSYKAGKGTDTVS